MAANVDSTRTLVVKFGGDVVADQQSLASVLAAVRGQLAAGARVVLCHGGGPQANALSSRLGLTPTKVGGRRVTDAATLEVMKYVLAGAVNVDVVAASRAAGIPQAVGLSGVSDGLVSAVRRPPKVVSGSDGKPVDFGFVGDVVEIRTGVITHLLAGGYMPVVNTLGIDAAGAVYNINADTISTALAGALAADDLYLITGVPGVLRDKDDPTTRLPRLTASEARQAIAEGVIVGGMIPKVEEALKQLSRGLRAVHILGAEGFVADLANPGSAGTTLIA